MAKKTLIGAPRMHGPPFKIEPVTAYDSNTLDTVILGYQLCVLDALNHIIWTMHDKRIYETPAAALKALGDRPRIYKEEGFDGGNPLPEFVAWCDYFAVFVPAPPEPKEEE